MSVKSRQHGFHIQFTLNATKSVAEVLTDFRAIPLAKDRSMNRYWPFYAKEDKLVL